MRKLIQKKDEETKLSSKENPKRPSSPSMLSKYFATNVFLSLILLQLLNGMESGDTGVKVVKGENSEKNLNASRHNSGNAKPIMDPNWNP
ncbi:hypothetical protein QE152_g36258 [Popillia japonica]|uniref:Uncharacterized protein n=1 Tax=Popillia japonica TaxID=7064 RepID=A0AAW1IDU4_POPJA